MPPSVQAVDHVHVFVENRDAAERWYADVLGFARTRDLEFWASGAGPLTLQDRDGTVHLALFERPRQACRSTIALRVSADEFIRWHMHLRAIPGLVVSLQDHRVALSLYISDPDGNPYEFTTYEYAQAKAKLE